MSSVGGVREDEQLLQSLERFVSLSRSCAAVETYAVAAGAVTFSLHTTLEEGVSKIII